MARKKRLENPWEDSSSGSGVPPIGSDSESFGPFDGPDSFEKNDFFDSPISSGGDDGPFGSDPPGYDALLAESSYGKASKAPTGILGGTVVAALAGLALGIFASTLPLLILGWALSSIVALGFATFYIRKDNRLQMRPFYLRRSFPRVFYRFSVLLAVVAIGVCAAQIALYMGRA